MTASSQLSAQSAVPELIFSDPLTSAMLVSGQMSKEMPGKGEFTPNGWRSSGPDGMLCIAIDKQWLGGVLEVDISGFDWYRANRSSGEDSKLHFMNMFSDKTGDHHIEQGGDENTALWTLRAGAGKDGKPRYGSTFKLLWSSRGVKRAPCNLYSENQRQNMAPATWVGWNTDSTYTFRIVWNTVTEQLTVWVNGIEFYKVPWKDQVQPLNYIFLGKANDFTSLQGVYFSNMRIYEMVGKKIPAKGSSNWCNKVTGPQKNKL